MGNKCETPKKDTYRGQAKGNCAHGTGKMVYSAVDKAGRLRYEGQFTNGTKQGEGTMAWNDGRIYSGGWWNDQMQGEGVMKWTAITNRASKSKIRQEKRTGLHHNKDSRTKRVKWYKGEWMMSRRNGFGQMKYAADDQHGRVIYLGSWAADKKEGNGFMEWQSGAKYLGQWHLGKRHGCGVFMFPNGDQLVGQWDAGVIENVSHVVLADGREFRRSSLCAPKAQPPVALLCEKAEQHCCSNTSRRGVGVLLLHS